LATGEVLVMRGTAVITINVPGDFSGDDQLTILDIDQLAVEAAAGTNNPTFDVNLDGLVDLSDVEIWIEDLYATSMGDANLDFAVDGQDFAIWNAHKFRELAGWSVADFNKASSPSRPIKVGRSNAVLSPVCPCSSKYLNR
jgi:hypothetical protein